MTPAEAAELMLGILNEKGYLQQEEATHRLMAGGDESCVYWNANGNPAIKPAVLKAFNALTPDVVWLRSSRYWRRREQGDQHGRMQPW